MVFRVANKMTVRALKQRRRWRRRRPRWRWRHKRDIESWVLTTRKTYTRRIRTLRCAFGRAIYHYTPHWIIPIIQKMALYSIDITSIFYYISIRAKLSEGHYPIFSFIPYLYIYYLYMIWNCILFEQNVRIDIKLSLWPFDGPKVK